MGSPISGKNAKLMYGSVVVANITEWSMSGFTQAMGDKTGFGETTKTFYVSEAGDPGTISFSGNYDPADTNGQVVINALCQAGTEITNLYLYANTSTFWRVGTGGTIIVTKGKAVSLPRNNFGTISFEGKVSGAAMEQVGTGS